MPVRKPSLPATSSLQSAAISFSIEPASCVWLEFMPNIMHFPIRVLTSESHRGLRAAVAGESLHGEVVWYRAWHPTLWATVGTGRRSAKRAISVRILLTGTELELQSVVLRCCRAQLRWDAVSRNHCAMRNEAEAHQARLPPTSGLDLSFHGHILAFPPQRHTTERYSGFE